MRQQDDGASRASVLTAEAHSAETTQGAGLDRTGTVSGHGAARLGSVWDRFGVVLDFFIFHQKLFFDNFRSKF